MFGLVSNKEFKHFIEDFDININDKLNKLITSVNNNEEKTAESLKNNEGKLANLLSEISSRNVQTNGLISNIEGTLHNISNEILSSKNLSVKLKKLNENAVIPTYAHNGDVGMDMVAISVEYDEELDMYIYHTGLAFESDFNVGQFLFPRSSNSKKEAYLTNSVGIADSAIYRGEIQFRFKNRTDIKVLQEVEGQKAYMDAFTKGMLSYTGGKTFKNYLSVVINNATAAKEIRMTEILNNAKNLLYAPYAVGDKVGQMVFMKYPTVNIEVVDELSDTDRGEGGFGSTGN